MNKSAIPVILMLCSMGVAAAASPTPAEPADSTASVTVKAQRQKLRELSSQMVKLEDQIFLNYNKFNPHRRYDVFCDMDIRTDSHIQYRKCEPMFVRDAREEEAQSFISETGLGGYLAQPASMAVFRQWPDFLTNYRKVINSHPELRKLDQQYGELQKDYKAVLNWRLTDHMIDWR